VLYFFKGAPTPFAESIALAGGADVAMVYCFNCAAEVWFKAIENKVNRAKNLQIWRVPTLQSQELSTLAARSMQLQVTFKKVR
jgi:uncharacterized protein YaeQ